MAFPVNWNVWKSNASMYAAVDPINYILGSGSLRMHRNAQASQYINCERASSPKGFTSGRLRFLLKRVASTSTDLFGCLFQQSQADLTGGAGSAYGAVLDSTGNTSAIIRLYKFTAGLATSSVIVNSGITVTTSAAVALECTWILDVAGTGGIRITVKYGTATDYSSLTTAIDTLVTSSVLTTSVAEGPCVALASTSSSGDYLYDQIECEPRIVGG